VANFVSLAQQKYFNSTPCHRLTTGSGLYVLQCGDPSGTGSGGPGYEFPDELTGTEKYTRGVLAMANAGANTNGSQFFIVYKDSQLPPKYTVFGSVTSGLGVVDKVAAKGVQGGGSDGKPALPITIQKVAVKT
jgi:peptidyl-prolyl cis-trans isomerase B (cyclophilin B)